MLRQFSEGNADYDPDTGKAILEGGSSTDAERKGLVLDQPGTQISQRFGNNMQANSLVQQKEKWLYLDALGPKPAMQDTLIVDQVEFAIIDVQEMGPGGVPLLYMIVVRS